MLTKRFNSISIFEIRFVLINFSISYPADMSIITTYSQFELIPVVNRSTGFESTYIGGGEFFVCGNLSQLGA